MVGDDNWRRTAKAFGAALAGARWRHAHALLTAGLAADITAGDLRTNYQHMCDYGDGVASHVEVMETLRDWPGRQRGDSGWAYVAIGGTNWSEAVALTLADEDGRSRIRSIDWGRP